MKPLYEITYQYQQIFDSLEDENGEISDSNIDQLKQLSTAIEDKAIAIASFIKNMDAEKKAIEEAKKSMATREMALNRKIDYFEHYLKSNMEACGIQEIKSSPYFTIKLKKCPISVDIVDEHLLPQIYLREKVSVCADKVKIKDDILAGSNVPGALLKQNVRLEIR